MSKMTMRCSAGQRSRTSSALSSCSSFSTNSTRQRDSLQRLAERFGFLLGMDAAADAAGAEDAEIDVHPFRARFGQHAGDVAGTEADRLQAHADLAHARAEFAPR